LANESVRENPALREAMSAHKSLKTQRDLFRTERDPSKVPARFAGYFRYAPVPATEELLALPSPLLAHFTHEQLLPVLEHTDRRVRLAGIQLVARLRGSEEPARERRVGR